MIARSVKFVLCAMVFTLMALALQTAEAKTLYIITIYGDAEDNGGRLLMKEDCEKIVNMFKSVGMPGGYVVNDRFLRLSNYDTQQELLDEIGAITRRATSSDAVLLYVATHGGFYREDDGVTEFVYYSTSLTNTYFNQQKVFKLLQESCDAKLKLIISDTCTVRLEKRSGYNNIVESQDDSNNDPYIRGGTSSNQKIPEIVFQENRPRLRNNLNWLMGAKGYYYIFSSLRGRQAYNGVFVGMFQKILNEETSFQEDESLSSQNEENLKRRFDVFLYSFESRFSLREDLRFYCANMGDIPIPNMTLNLAGNRVEKFDRSKGVLVLWTQYYYDFSPAKMAGLQKGDVVLGYILSDYQYNGQTSWTELNCIADIANLSKRMQNQRYMHLLVLQMNYDSKLKQLYYETVIKPDINLIEAREENGSHLNDLKIGLKACGFNELTIYNPN